MVFTVIASHDEPAAPRMVSVANTGTKPIERATVEAASGDNMPT